MFESGTATSREDLLDKLRLFMISAGYTINRFAASGTGFVLNTQKLGSYSDTIYPSLRSVNNENLAGSAPQCTGLVASMADGYDSSKDCVDQTNSPRSIISSTDYFAAVSHPISTVATYWFFHDTNPEFLAMVLQLPNGHYKHHVFGQIEKTDASIGRGDFFFGTNGMSTNNPAFPLPFESVTGASAPTSTSYLRLIMDERDGWWTPANKAQLSGAINSTGLIFGANYIDSLLRKHSLNRFSNGAAMTPFHLYALKQNGERPLVGHIPNWRSIRREALLVGQEYSLGSDVWMAFPVSTPTGIYSLAYRKVV